MTAAPLSQRGWAAHAAADGSTPKVEPFAPRLEPEPVYNIGAEGDHCCRASEKGLLVHNTSVGPNPIPKIEGEREAAAIRQQFNIPASQNIAYAEVNVDSYQDELIAVSGGTPVTPAQTAPVPVSRLFDTIATPPGHYRGNDAEAKLLEAIARAVEPNAQKGQCCPNRTGTIRLYSDFTICGSCSGVIAAFQAMFPNVIFSYSDGT